MSDWKEQARQRSLEGLRRMTTPEPPQVADSDLIVMAINRLERAVVKMQAFEYDDQLQEHLSRAAEMLGWVAQNMWDRTEGTNDE
jgi:hypothetical protein